MILNSLLAFVLSILESTPYISFHETYYYPEKNALTPLLFHALLCKLCCFSIDPISDSHFFQQYFPRSLNMCQYETHNLYLFSIINGRGVNGLVRFGPVFGIFGTKTEVISLCKSKPKPNCLTSVWIGSVSFGFGRFFRFETVYWIKIFLELQKSDYLFEIFYRFKNLTF